MSNDPAKTKVDVSKLKKNPKLKIRKIHYRYLKKALVVYHKTKEGNIEFNLLIPPKKIIPAKYDR